MSGAEEARPAPEERVRLFVALELPESIRKALVDWREGAVRHGPHLRPLSSDLLHVTLCFLGWQDARELEAIAAACTVVSGQPAPRLSLGDPGWLPRRRPRVLAVELADRAGELAQIQAELSRVLVEGAWYEPERRPYLAHVTVARVPRGARAPRDPLPSTPRLEFSASRVTLFRSRLHRSGARYEPLAAIELAT